MNSFFDIAFISGIESAFNVDSWYNDMFSLEDHIASGGFGVVVKARNKLDNKMYAIKKIPLVDTDMKKMLQVYFQSNFYQSE